MSVVLSVTDMGSTGANWTNETGFLSLPNAAIYDLVIEWTHPTTAPPGPVTPGPNSRCRLYKSAGWPFRMFLCMMDDNQGPDTYIKICKSQLEMIVMQGSCRTLRQ